MTPKDGAKTKAIGVDRQGHSPSDCAADRGLLTARLNPSLLHPVPFPPTDPLKIYYLVVHPAHDLEDMSPFQGFGPGWAFLDWSLWAMAELPADVLEGGGPIDPLISQRMGGSRSIDWTPISINALETLDASYFSLFTVAFSGEPEVAARLNAWRTAKGVRLLHVSSVEGAADLNFRDLDAARVIGHCRQAFRDRAQDLDEGRRATASEALATWAPREAEPLPLRKRGHNALIPNYMSLERAGRRLQEGEAFVANTDEAYDEAILEGARAVLEVRARAGLRNANRMSLIHPEVYLAEPALYRHAYARARVAGPPEQAGAARVVRLIQAQRGFSSEVSPDFLQMLTEPGLPQAVLNARQAELNTFMTGVGLVAAQSTSAVLRLSPAVNHVFPALTGFARSIRSDKAEHRLKQPRLFKAIQDQLAAAVGPRRMEFLRSEVSGPLKIVSDAPIEWLPIGDLPLMMRFQTSRLNATPGNLLMGELARNDVVTVHPEDLCDVLVLSAFRPDDRLRNLLRVAVEEVRPACDGKVKVAFKDVRTVDQFADALNEFRGSILVFDGHGALSRGDDGIGRLMIADEPLDVWHLRGKVRVPPIVILSACDTQGLDAPSHATVGNGFLALGATTVVGTLLPVGAVSSAGFVARLVYRLAEFIPAALSAGIRVLNWTEVIWGMQRMLLASEILDELVGPLKEMDSPRARMQTAANLGINSYDPEWFEKLVLAVAEQRAEAEAAIRTRIARVIARSEAIRYVQLGHPENILIDDGSIFEAVVPSEVRSYASRGERT